MNPVRKVNLAEAFGRFSDHWSPKIAAELNGQLVKLPRFLGPFVWHRHEQEDELFLVVRAELRIEFDDAAVTLAEGEMAVVPRGVEHRPVADAEALVLLFEPAATRNTGNVTDARSKTSGGCSRNPRVGPSLSPSRSGWETPCDAPAGFDWGRMGSDRCVPPDH